MCEERNKMNKLFSKILKNGILDVRKVTFNEKDYKENRKSILLITDFLENIPNWISNINACDLLYLRSSCYNFLDKSEKLVETKGNICNIFSCRKDVKELIFELDNIIYLVYPNSVVDFDRQAQYFS